MPRVHPCTFRSSRGGSRRPRSTSPPDGRESRREADGIRRCDKARQFAPTGWLPAHSRRPPIARGLERSPGRARDSRGAFAPESPQFATRRRGENRQDCCDREWTGFANGRSLRDGARRRRVALLRELLRQSPLLPAPALPPDGRRNRRSAVPKRHSSGRIGRKAPTVVHRSLRQNCRSERFTASHAAHCNEAKAVNDIDGCRGVNCGELM